MKKFFKALALVLALALVVGVVPAQSASAKAKAKKVLYTATPTGWSTTDDTLKSSLKTKVRIYTLAGDKKAAAEDHEYKAVIKDGEGIVDVTEKYVVGKKLGKAVVDIYKDEKLVGTTTVTVRKNADASTLKLQVKEGDAFVNVTADTEFVAGVTYRLALPRAKADSDERRLFVDDKAVTEDEKLARQYDVVFEAGEHTIAFEAFQGGKLDGATAKDSIKITAVKPQPKELKQLSANSFAVVFSHDMTGLIDPAKIENDDIYYEIAGEKIVTGAIKSSTIDKEDPTRVVITRYTNFIEGETYFFHYGESKDLSFKAAVNKAENVDSITVSVDGNCYVEEAKAINVKYFDKNGVELSIDATPIFVITPDELAYQSVTDSGAAAINFAAEGTATIKVTVTLGYDQETYAPIEKTASCEVKATKKSAEATSVVYSFGDDAAKEVHFIRMNAGSADLKATFKGADGNKVSDYVSSTNASEYYLKSTAEDIVQIDADNKVYGVNTGNAVILMCYKDANEKEQVVKAFPIEVKEANKGTTAVTAVLDKSTINTYYTGAAGTAEDEVNLKVTVLDLNGKAYDEANLVYELKQVDNNAKSVGLELTSANISTILATKADPYSNNEVVFTFVGDNFTDYVSAAANNSWDANHLARVAFELTVKDVTNGVANAVTLAKKTLSITVAEINPDRPGTGVTVGYKVVADETKLDASKKNFKHATTAVVTSTVEVQRTATKNGNVFYLGTDEFTVIKSRNDIPVTVASSTFGPATTGSINYLIPTTPYNTVTVVADRTAITTSDQGDYYGFAGAHNIAATGVNSITVQNFEDDTLDKAVAKTGTYTFTGVRVDYTALIDANDTTASLGVKQNGARKEIGAVSITVSASDAKATFAEKSGINATTLAANVGTGNSVAGQYKVSWDGINTESTNDDAGRITIEVRDNDYKVDAKTGAIYIYYITATIKTFDAHADSNGYNNTNKTMTLVQKIAVNKLYKDR